MATVGVLSVSVNTTSETAWLIEFPSGLYLGRTSCKGASFKRTTHESAIRFSREEDARAVLCGLLSAGILKDSGQKVTEHEWLASAPDKP